MMNKTVALGLVVSFLTVPAFANNFYILGNYSQNSFKAGYSGDSALTSVHRSSQLALVEDNDASFGIGVGYRADDIFSFEFAYNDLGHSVLRDTVSYHDSGSSTVYETSVDWHSLQASVVAELPLNESFKLYSRFGTSRLMKEYQTQNISEAPYEIHRDKSSHNKALLGAGAGYKFNQDILFRVEYDRYANASRDYLYSSFLIGIVYSL